MMYRSNWARSPSQERILGIWLKREAFEELLALSEQTSHGAAATSKEEWKKRRAQTKNLADGSQLAGRVNIQWDPDHHPSGTKMTRRAIQIGIKCVPWWITAEKFEKIIDFTPLVEAQRDHVPNCQTDLFTPQEKLYVVKDEALALHARCETNESDLEEEKSNLAS